LNEGNDGPGATAIKDEVASDEGCTLLDPEHMKIQSDDVEEFHEHHPKYQAAKTSQQVFRDTMEANKRVMVGKLPFPCDSSGFYDILRPADCNAVDIGIFPIGTGDDDISEDADAGYPAPSMKKLSLTLEALDKPKISQTPKIKNHMAKKKMPD
jgi:hypothetical protein